MKKFIRIVAEMRFKPEVELQSFKGANQAIMDIKQPGIKGGKVLMIPE